MTTTVTIEQVRAIAPRVHLAYQRALSGIDDVLARYGVNASALRVAHFVAQLAHESGGFTIFEENLSYSTPARLQAVFGRKRFPTLEYAETFVRNPIELARKVYGGRMGNTVTNDDGWNFRGRGPLQLTGRDNYRRFGAMIGVDLEADPGLATDPRYLFEIPAAYWKSRGCNEAADADDIVRVTKLVNGGSIGLPDRREWLKKAKAVWS